MAATYPNSTILVVDDEADLREYISAILEPLEANIITASSGNSAYDIIKNNAVHLVVSDAIMPDGGGIELLDKIKQLPSPRPEFILVSGYAGISVPDAYAKGVVAFFPKPFQAKALLDSVIYAMEFYENKQKRKFPRLVPDDPNTKLEAVLSAQTLHKKLSANIVNFSLGGMYIATATGNTPPAIGEKIEFEIRCSNHPEKKWKGEGVVRWVRNDGFGIEFVSNNSQQKKLAEIYNFIQTKEIM